MTISSTNASKVGLGNGATTAFTYDFIIPSADDVQVTYIDASGNQTPLSPSQYTISGLGSASGGTVTYPLSGSPIASGTSIVISRVLALTQPTALVNQGGYFPAVVESAMDRIVMLLQQISIGFNGLRALLFPASDVNPTRTLPVAAARANKYLAFDSNGNPVAMSGTSSSPDISANTALATSSTTARSMSRRFADVINVKDFGAVGNGVTDDAAAIQAAITFAATLGAQVFVPSATYVCGSAITLKTGVELLGAGKESSILRFTGGTDGLVMSDAFAVVVIRNLKIQTSNAAAGKAINFSNKASGAAHCIIDSVEIAYTGSGRWSYGLWATSFQTSRLTSLRCYQAATVGFRLEYACNALVFVGCEIVGSSGVGTIARGLDVDGTSSSGGTALFEFYWHGGTIQGYFTHSAVNSAGWTSPKVWGLHVENTNGAPSAGADIVINGTSVNASFTGLQGGSLITAGTIRNLNIRDSEMTTITLAAGTQAAIVGVRYSTLNNSADILNQFASADSSGNPRVGYLVDTVSMRNSLPSITSNSTTPAVPDTEVVYLGNTVPTSITDFPGGQTGQRLTLIFLNGNTTIVNGTINLNAAAGNMTGALGSTLTLVSTGTGWFELCRSVN